MRFEPCRRVERRRKAKAWMQDFLDVFLSDECISVEDLLYATRVWPEADEYVDPEIAIDVPVVLASTTANHTSGVVCNRLDTRASLNKWRSKP